MLKFYLITALSLLPNVVYSFDTDDVDWMLGQYEVRVSEEKLIAFRTKSIDGKLVAVVASKESGAIQEELVSIMSSSDMTRMFGTSIKDLYSIKCFEIGLLIVCSSSRDLKIEEAKISIAKGFFGIAPDVGIVDVTRKE